MTETTPPATPTAKPKSRRLLKILAVLAVGFVAFIALLPTIASWTLATSSTRSGLADALGTDVELQSVSFGWFSGLSIEGLSIQNPPGFADQPCVELEALEGDVSFLGLMRGRIDLRGRIAGLAVRVIQRKDGTINLEKLGKRSDVEPQPPSSEGPQTTDRDQRNLIANSRLDLVLENATVLVEHEELGTIEQITDLDVTIRKPFGSSDVKLELGADFAGGAAAGRLDLALDADANMERPANARLSCKSIDLARYRPLLEARLPEPIEEFAGIVEGDIQAQVEFEKQLLVGGELRVIEPRIAGPAFGGMQIRAPVWIVRPDISATLGEQPKIDTAKLEVDLGFLKIRGLDSAQTEALCGGPGFGATFDIDLSQVTKFGGVIPADLEADGLQLTGKAALRADGGQVPTELEAVFGALGLDARLRADRLSIRERVVTGLDAVIEVKNGPLGIAVKEGAKLDGGVLHLGINGDLRKLETESVEVYVSVRGAQLGGSAVEGLRFAVPVLAGISPDAANVDFNSGADLQMRLRGPALPSEGEGTFEWLDHWTGTGELSLQQGSFTPAPAIAQLLEFAGKKNKWNFKSVNTAFGLDQGAISNQLLKLSSDGRELRFKGRTTLRGEMQYDVDVSDFLKGHRDGEKILKFIGKEALAAQLTGTLDAPQLSLPNLSKLIEQAASKALEAAAKGQLDNALKGIFGRDKKK